VELIPCSIQELSWSECKYFWSGFPRNFVPVFLGVELLDLPLITKKAFETARLVMGRRNVDFDEKRLLF
jgi:hypothetical protein